MTPRRGCARIGHSIWPVKRTKKPNIKSPTLWSRFRENWRLLVVSTVVVASFAGSGYLYHSALAAQKPADFWPSTEAVIVSSEVSQTSAPPPNRSAITARLELSYKIDGRDVNAKYVRTWTTHLDNDYGKLLAKGSKVPIKYSPLDTTLVSLEPLGP